MALGGANDGSSRLLKTVLGAIPGRIGAPQLCTWPRAFVAENRHDRELLHNPSAMSGPYKEGPKTSVAFGAADDGSLLPERSAPRWAWRVGTLGGRCDTRLTPAPNMGRR